jgi:hypothetical protein
VHIDVWASQAQGFIGRNANGLAEVSWDNVEATIRLDA